MPRPQMPSWNGGDLTSMAHTLSTMHPPPPTPHFHQDPIAKPVSPLHQQMLPIDGMRSPLGNQIIGSPPHNSILGTSPMNHGGVIRSPIRNQTPSEVEQIPMGAEMCSDWEVQQQQQQQRPHAHNQAMYTMQPQSPEPMANVPRLRVSFKIITC